LGKKKKHAEEHENLERWLVSYADFITLLFATFVVLYALSQIDLAKFKDLKISLKKAFTYSPTIFKGEPGILKEKGDSLLESGSYLDEQNLIPPILDAIAAKEEEKNYDLVQETLKLEQIDEIRGIKTRVTERGLIITFIGSIIFEPSSAEMKESSKITVKRIAQILKQKFPYNIIRVEGHTDSMPMSSTIYPSNWELSAARAAGLLRYITQITGFENDRFVVVGYGDTRPIATNSTEAGRYVNRRVEIVVLRSRLINAELQTYKFQQERKKRLELIEELDKKKKQEENNLSDAAQKLLEEKNNSSKQLILQDESTLSKDEKEIKRQLENYEKEANLKIKKKLFFKSLQNELKN